MKHPGNIYGSSLMQVNTNHSQKFPSSRESEGVGKGPFSGAYVLRPH